MAYRLFKFEATSIGNKHLSYCTWPTVGYRYIFIFGSIQCSWTVYLASFLFVASFDLCTPYSWHCFSENFICSLSASIEVSRLKITFPTGWSIHNDVVTSDNYRSCVRYRFNQPGFRGLVF